MTVLTPSLLEAAEKLPPRELDALVKQILALRARRVAPVISSTVGDLLKAIELAMPATLRKQYAEAVMRVDQQDIAAEHRDAALEIAKSYERGAARRAGLIAQLAVARGTSIEAVMDEFDLNLPEHV